MIDFVTARHGCGAFAVHAYRSGFPGTSRAKKRSTGMHRMPVDNEINFGPGFVRQKHTSWPEKKEVARRGSGQSAARRHKCSFSAVDPPVLRWSRDGVSLKGSPREGLASRLRGKAH